MILMAGTWAGQPLSYVSRLKPIAHLLRSHAEAICWFVVIEGRQRRADVRWKLSAPMFGFTHADDAIVMSPFLRSILATPTFHRFLYHFIRVYSLTFRLSIENEAGWQELIDKGTPVLLCAWHQQFFSAIRHFKHYAKYHPALMISRSQDGAIIAAVARKTGWKTVRGSSSRGGKQALRSMIRHLERSRLAAHILDGPTGPMGVVKAGAVRLAHAARATIVPFSVSAHRAVYFNSWDRFMLPLPFARVTLRFGDPVQLAPTNDPDDFEQQRARLETLMAPCLKVRRYLSGTGS